MSCPYRYRGRDAAPTKRRMQYAPTKCAYQGGAVKEPWLNGGWWVGRARKPRPYKIEFLCVLCEKFLKARLLRRYHSSQ